MTSCTFTTVATVTMLVATATGIAVAETPEHPTGPVALTIEGFFRDSDALTCGVACGSGGCDSDGASSNTFTDPGGAALAFEEGQDAGCDAAGSSIAWMQTTSPTPGPIMSFTVELTMGCIPDTVCPISGDIALTPEAEAMGGSANATINTGTTWWTTFTVHQTSDITITGFYAIEAVVSGNADQSNATALARQTVQGPGFVVLDEEIADLGFVGNGFDSRTGNPALVIQDAAPGLYLVGGSLNAQGGVFFDDSNTGVASFDITGEASVTVTVNAGGVQPADFNLDGLVNFTDLLQMLGNWGSCGGCPEDLNGNGSVDFGDVLLLLAAWS